MSLGFSHLPIYSITNSRAVPVTGDQSGSDCYDADVEFDFSDNGISENETDTDVMFCFPPLPLIEKPGYFSVVIWEIYLIREEGRLSSPIR